MMHCLATAILALPVAIGKQESWVIKDLQAGQWAGKVYAMHSRPMVVLARRGNGSWASVQVKQGWMIPSQLPEQLVTAGFLTDFKKPAKNVTYSYQMMLQPL